MFLSHIMFLKNYKIRFGRDIQLSFRYFTWRSMTVVYLNVKLDMQFHDMVFQ